MRDVHGEKGVAALSLMDRCKERRRIRADNLYYVNISVGNKD